MTEERRMFQQTKEEKMGDGTNKGRKESMEGESRGEASAVSEMKREGLSFAASLKEGWQYIKASVTGQVMKLKAKNEEEASEADLQTAKMQVEAADEAENKKKQLQN